MASGYLVCRCVLRRQCEALEAIVNLVSSGEAHSSVPLLRPACEEFLWGKYLRTLKPELPLFTINSTGVLPPLQEIQMKPVIVLYSLRQAKNHCHQDSL